MKVVCQNGVQYSFSRSEAEALVALLPVSLCRNVNILALGHEGTRKPTVSYYSKERELWLFWDAPPATNEEKTEVVELIIVTLSIIEEKGDCPQTVKSSLYWEHASKRGTLIEEAQKSLKLFDQ